MDARSMKKDGVAGVNRKKRRFGELESREASSTEAGAVCFNQSNDSQEVTPPKKLPKIDTGGNSKYMELKFIPEQCEPQHEPQVTSHAKQKSSLEEFFDCPKEEFVHEQVDLSRDVEASEPAGEAQDEMGGELAHPSKEICEIPGLEIAEPSCPSDNEQLEDCPRSPVLDTESVPQTNIGEVGELCLVSPGLEAEQCLPCDIGQVRTCTVSPALDIEPCLPWGIGQARECFMSPGTYTVNCAFHGLEEAVVNYGSPASCADTDICLLGNEMVTYTVDEVMRESEMAFGGYLPGPTLDAQEPGEDLGGMGIGGLATRMEPLEGTRRPSGEIDFHLPGSAVDEWLEGTPWNASGPEISGYLPGPTVEECLEGTPNADGAMLEEDLLSTPSEIDSILQRLIDQDAIEEETPQSQNIIQWSRPPAKLIGLDPAPLAPPPSASMEIVQCSGSDVCSLQEDTLEGDQEWQAIPGVQLYENVQLDTASVEQFRFCQAEYRRILNQCKRKEADRVKHCKGNRRPDLRAMQDLPHTEWLNQGPIIGHIPGLAVNTVFEYKAEMHVLGVHKGHSRGISYCCQSKARPGVPIAYSICMSSQYQYDENGFFEAWYTGEGGNFTVFDKKKAKKNQALTRGNEALCNSMRLKLPVRVIKKVSYRHYVYDGLWDVVDVEMGQEEGKVVYRFKVRRREKQASPLEEIEFSCENPLPLQIDYAVGAITDDLACGLEQNPIPVVNTVDWELAPGIAKNDEDDNNWVESIDMFEYGIESSYSDNVVENCGVEYPLLFRLQVFRKAESDDEGTGWGVRTMEHIPADSYIAAYIGDIVNLEADFIPDDDVFCHDLPLRALKSDTEEEGDLMEEEITHAISSASYGNISRFIEHSETPNCAMRGVFSQHRCNRLAKLCIFSLTDIQPGEEITFHHFAKVDCLMEDEKFEVLG